MNLYLSDGLATPDHSICYVISGYRKLLWVLKREKGRNRKILGPRHIQLEG
jgi:hypothetical protein